MIESDSFDFNVGEPDQETIDKLKQVSEKYKPAMQKVINDAREFAEYVREMKKKINNE